MGKAANLQTCAHSALTMQSRKLRAMAEGQQAWKQACTERWDAFLVDKDTSPLPDTPSVWLSAFRWVKLPWGPEPLLQQHPTYRLTRLNFAACS